MAKKGPLAETETIGKWYFSQKKMGDFMGFAADC